MSLLFSHKINYKISILRWTEIIKDHKGKRGLHKFQSVLIGNNNFPMIKEMVKTHQYFTKKILLKSAQRITTVVTIEHIKIFKVTDVIDEPNKNKKIKIFFYHFTSGLR